MDPTIWGPHYWFTLHTIAFHYPKHPTAIQKKIHYRLIHNFHEFIPNPSISVIYSKTLLENPVTPYLDTRDDFILWLHHFHNKINERLHKPTISLADHYSEFQKHFETPKKKWKRLWKEKFIIFIFLLMGFALLYAIPKGEHYTPRYVYNLLK
jgi:hypothetical protein